MSPPGCDAMDISQQKQQFSLAYSHAVATVAGLALCDPRVDDDSIDVMFAQRGGSGTIRSPRLEAQLKCTKHGVTPGKNLSFDLKLKNYNDLRDANVVVPRILVVMTVPGDDPAQWLTHSVTDLIMRHCAWWVSLRGLPPSTNATTVAVSIPQAQLFSPQQLLSIFDRLSSGGLP